MLILVLLVWVLYKVTKHILVHYPFHQMVMTLLLLGL